MLKIWTGAKLGDIKKTVNPAVKAQPEDMEYKVFPLNTEFPPPLSKGDVCLAQGSKALAKIQEMGLVPKGRTVTSLRSTEIPYQDGILLITYDPGIAMIDYGKYVDMQIDISLACRAVITGTIKPKIGNYRWVTDFSSILDTINTQHHKTGKLVPVSMDLETVGLNEYDEEAWIVSISLTVSVGTADVVYFTGVDDQPKKGSTLWNQISEVLNSTKALTRGANGKYDRRWMKKKWGMDNSNYKFDTTLVGSLLDENRSNSLNTHAKIYTTMGGYDDEFNKSHNKGAMQEIPKDSLLPYAGGDTDATQRVANAMRNLLLQDQALTRFYVELLHPASICLQEMEEEGIIINVDYYMKLQHDLTIELQSVEKQAISMMPRRLQIKHQGNTKLTRAALIKDYMFGKQGLNLVPLKVTEKTGQPSTAKEHLLMFSEYPEVSEFLKLYQEYSTLSKTLGTYITGFLKHLHPDGRFHPTAIMYKGDYGGTGDSGTVTGRLAFKAPAVQTIPKHSKYAGALRVGYEAPEGCKVVNLDYSQGELKITACLANEPTMIELYKQGVDLHMVTGGQLNGYNREDMEIMKVEDPKMYKAMRQGGKAGNFGLIYGMGANGYRIYAKDTYGVEMTDQEAHNQREAFFELYPGLIVWHKTYQAHARRWGQVRSPLGRVRHLPLINSPDRMASSKAERQAINSPVQATLSDLTMYTLVEFRKKYGNPDGCKFCLTTHDSLTAYMKDDEVDTWLPRVAHIMENLPLEKVFGWKPQIPFTVDAEVGTNFDNVVEVDRCW